MRIFALETNIEKLNQSFLSRDENIIIAVRFHSFLFFLSIMRGLLVTVLLVGLAIAVAFAGISWSILFPILGIAWLILVARPLIRSFIDWQFDEIVVTTEKVVIVNQSSIFRQEIRQMNLENMASVNARTQYWGLFPFGEIAFELKEGTGEAIRLGYIPAAQRVASVISDRVVQFQRRQANTPLQNQ